MAQLIMRWENDGYSSPTLVWPAGVAVRRFHQLAGPMYAWLNIVRYMAQGEPEEIADGPAFYRQVMTDQPHYREDYCFFLLVEGVPAATVTVICDSEKQEGYVHMVACKPAFRGRGLGHLLAALAVDVLKREGMQRAYLTTDDWRIPAIKTYLKVGFTPDLTGEPDYPERWERIYAEMGRAVQ